MWGDVRHPRLYDTRPRALCLATGPSPLTGLPLHHYHGWTLTADHLPPFQLDRHTFAAAALTTSPPGTVAFPGCLPAGRLHDQAAPSDRQRQRERERERDRERETERETDRQTDRDTEAERKSVRKVSEKKRVGERVAGVMECEGETINERTREREIKE